MWPPVVLAPLLYAVKHLLNPGISQLTPVCTLVYFLCTYRSVFEDCTRSRMWQCVSSLVCVRECVIVFGDDVCVTVRGCAAVSLPDCLFVFVLCHCWWVIDCCIQTHISWHILFLESFPDPCNYKAGRTTWIVFALIKLQRSNLKKRCRKQGRHSFVVNSFDLSASVLLQYIVFFPSLIKHFWLPVFTSINQ